MDTPNQETGLSKKQQRRLEKEKMRQERHAGQMVKSSGSRAIFWIVILAIIGFFVYAIYSLATHTPDVSNLTTDVIITADDHALGNPTSSVQLVEYADFQCPGCGAFHPIVKRLTTEYQDRIYYAYRHFPLPQHSFAKIMARASEAADKQGKFWEMHDLIFENQTAWALLPSADKTISTFVTKLKLDADQFENDIDSAEVKDTVEADHQGGISYGVNSTPSFLLNGVKIALPRNYEEFKALIDAALANNHGNTTSTPAN